MKRLRINKTILLVWMTCLVLVCSCKNKKDQSEIEKQAFDKPLTHHLSFIEAPIVFQVEQIEDKINEAIKGTLYDDQSFDSKTDGVKMRVEKVGRIQVQIVNDYLYYSIPLSVWASKRFFKNRIFRKKIETSKDVNFSLRVQFRSKVGIDKNWRFKTKTKYIGVKWIKRPHVKVLGIDFDLARVLETQVLQKKNELEKVIDKAAYQLNVIEKQVSKIWTKIQQPILIEKKLTKYTWLVAEPVQISVSQAKGKNKQLFITTKLETYVNMVVGDSPVIQHKPLPPLKNQNALDQNQFELYVKGEVPYRVVNKLISRKVKDTTINIPQTEYQIKINKAEIFGSGKKVYLKLQIEGDASGTIYLHGEPRFDTRGQTLHFDNFDYDLESEEYLLQTANWMLKRVVKEEIQKVLVLPLDEYIDQLPQLIKKGLSKGKMSKTALFDLQNFELHPEYMQVDENHLRIYAKATGEVGVEIIKI